MASLGQIVEDAFCPFLPLWRSLLVIEMTFLVLLGISALLRPGRISIAVPFSLLFIVPTIAAVLGLVYYCERE